MLIRSLPNPISGIHSEMANLFRDAFVPINSMRRLDSLHLAGGALSIKSDHDSVHVEAELPGVKIEDLEITIHGKKLTIKGERKAPVMEGAKWHRQERRFGTFERHIELPAAVESDKVEAVLRNGILSVSMPKQEHQRPHKIAVTTTR